MRNLSFIDYGFSPMSILHFRPSFDNLLEVRSQLLKDDVARELGDLVTVFSSRVQEYVVALDGQKRKVAIATESTARFLLVRMIQSARFIF